MRRHHASEPSSGDCDVRRGSFDSLVIQCANPGSCSDSNGCRSGVDGFSGRGREDVDAVIIATPNLFHGPIAQAAIAAGKHVLCEKPIAMNYQEAKAMAEAADQAGSDT